VSHRGHHVLVLCQERYAAIHVMAVTLLRGGDAVWTTGSDESIEEAAEHRGVHFHRLLPGERATCECELGHLVKLSDGSAASRTPARGGRALVVLPPQWSERLVLDFRGATAAVIGCAWGDVVAEAGLDAALDASSSALWFARREDEARLRRRFKGLLASCALQLRVSERPEFAALQWGRAEGLIGFAPPAPWMFAEQ
jgi:hypothetical protein